MTAPDLRRLAGSVIRISDRLSAKRPATRVGAAGGVAAMLAGEALSQLAPGTATPLVRTALTLLGILLAHLIWRGRDRTESERRFDAELARREALIAQIGEVRKLLAGERKSNTPSLQVIEELERQHLDLVRELAEAHLPMPVPRL